MDQERLLRIFETAVLARRYEARIVELAMAGELPPALHTGAGHEIAQIAAIEALEADDPILYGHRGLAYMVARGVDLAAMLADFVGKDRATSRGKGGIMHVVDTAHGILGESGTLGGSFTIAVGVGMALQRKHPGRVVAYFFGDGTSNRGTFHESLNWAAVQKLPCIFFCENNGLAVSVPASRSTAVENIADRAAGYGIPGHVVDGNDPDAVFETMSAAVARARAGEGPSLIEAKVTRLHGHYAADPQDYRADRDTVAERDPLPELQQRLVDSGALDAAAVAELEADVAARIDAAVESMRGAAPLPSQAAFEDLYA